MKKAFTLIELVFVIVILGILSAVGISKINATRDDAELVKFLNNIAAFKKDIESYYGKNGTTDAKERHTNYF